MRTLNRRLLLGAALGACALPLAAVPNAFAQQGGVIGCPLCQRIGEPFGVNAKAGRPVKIARSSGDAETDHFLGVALGHLSSAFEVSPGFAFYDDSASPNAHALSKTLVGNGPGTV